MNVLRAGGLTRRIYIAFLVTALLPTAIAGSIGVWLSMDRLKAATIQGLQQEVSARGAGLRLFLNTVASELQFLATDPRALALLSGTSAPQAYPGPKPLALALGDVYARLVNAQPDVYQVRLLDATGFERVRVDRRAEGVVIVPSSELQDKSDRYYVRAALSRPAGTVYVSPLDLNVEHGQVEKPERPVIRLATVLTSPDGATLGLVIVNLHAQVLIEPVQQMVLAREGTAYLFDRSSQFLARGGGHGENGFLMQPVANLGPAAGALLGRLAGETAGSFTADGTIWAHAAVDLSGDPTSADAPLWAIAIAFPERALLRQVLDLAKLYGVLAAALLMAALAGYSISRRLVGPLDDLSKEADAIASGDFGRRVQVAGNDEIARLGERFNLMAARLQATLVQLQQHRDQLEIEVLQRTGDLAAERARLAAVLRHTSDAIAALRPSGEVLFANQAAELLLSQVTGDQDKGVSGVLGRLIGDAQPGRAEIVLDDRTLSVSRDTLPATNGSGDLVIVVRDVTQERRHVDEKREFDRQVFQLDKLATVGELAMGAAHEIGNPLAGMKAVVQSLLLEHGLPIEVTQDLERLESEIDRLARFLGSFRGMAASREVHLSAQPLGAAVEDMLFWVRKPAKSSGVEVTSEIPQDLPSLSADPAQLREVLLNLFVNALQAMPEGGRLAVDAAVSGRDIVIEVSDTGRGIPAELRSRIFERFFTTRPGGSGLGLAVCAKVVEDHGGRIEVRSQPGDTRFVVHWPLWGAS
jgi:signal transduction histidine kinase